MRSFVLTIAALAVMVGFVFGGMWLEGHRAAQGKEPFVAEAEKTSEKAIDKMYEDWAKRSQATTGGATSTKVPLTAEQRAKLSQAVMEGRVPGPGPDWAQTYQPPTAK